MPMGKQSTKVRALVEDLVRVRQEKNAKKERQSKSVIFSQWTQVLDLIEVNFVALLFFTFLSFIHFFFFAFLLLFLCFVF